jgi:IS5 family transposase
VAVDAAFNVEQRVDALDCFERNQGERNKLGVELPQSYTRVVPAMEQLVGAAIERLLADAGYRGHNAPPDYKFKVHTSKQKRRVTPHIQRERRHRSAIEPVIGHLKNEHRMGRNYLADRQRDANKAILAAVGYNFRRLIRWLRFLLWLILAELCAPSKSLQA